MIFKLIIIWNFKALFSGFNFRLYIPSFFHSRKESIITGAKSPNKLPKRLKRYEWILQSRQTPIVLMWLHERNQHPECKKAGSLLALSFSSFTMLSLKRARAFVSISCFLFSSNSCSFRVSKSPLPFGPHYSSPKILLACSLSFKVLSSHLCGFTFFPSINYVRGKKDAVAPQSLKQLCLSLAVGQGTDAAAKLHFHMYFMSDLY